MFITIKENITSYMQKFTSFSAALAVLAAANDVQLANDTGYNVDNVISHLEGEEKFKTEWGIVDNEVGGLRYSLSGEDRD